MKEPKIGQTSERELTVTHDKLAVSVSSGSVEVLATPVVAAMMEGAAADLAQTYLDDEFTTVGAEICVQHLAPSPEGVKVKAVAELTAVEGRKYSFSLKAFDEAGLIATGTHQRVAVRRGSFAKKAAARKAN